MENHETVVNHGIANGPYNAYAHLRKTRCSKMLSYDEDEEMMTSTRPTSCLFCLADVNCR